MNTLIFRQLSDEAKLALMQWFAQGYTARRIAEKLLATYDVVISDAELAQAAVLYSSDIAAFRTEMHRNNLVAGLATREERVRRLTELAESWEETAQTNVKAANVYLKTLDTIREEAEPLERARIPANDPWAMLMEELKTGPQLKPQIPSSTNSE